MRFFLKTPQLAAMIIKALDVAENFSYDVFCEKQAEAMVRRIAGLCSAMEMKCEIYRAPISSALILSASLRIYSSIEGLFKPMRRIFMWTISLALAASVSLSVQAADPKRDRNWVPPQDDATVGVLGGARKDQHPEVRGNLNAPIPSVVLPKVETSIQHQDVPSLSAAPSNLPSQTNPMIAPAGSQAAPLDAAPRPSVQPQGPGGYYAGSSAPSAPLAPISPTNTFLAQHPFLSGLVAGAVGTEIGSLFYGGVMTGDANAVMIGYIARMGLIVLIILMVMRSVWKSVANKAQIDQPSRKRTRREPGFGASGDYPNRGNRREPTF